MYDISLREGNEYGDGRGFDFCLFLQIREETMTKTRKEMMNMMMIVVMMAVVVTTITAI